MISACIGFKDRDERLLTATIDNLLAEGIDEIMLCNFGAKALTIEREKLFHIHIPLDRWRFGLAFNICAVHAVGDILLFTNGGMILSSDVIERSRSLVVPGKQYVGGVRHYLRCSKEQTDTYLKDPKYTDLALDADCYTSPMGRGDLHMLSRQDFFRIGGWDSEMQGWGRADVCIHNRLTKLGYHHVIANGSHFHLYDGFSMSRQSEEDYKINDRLLKTKQKWWRNDQR